MTPIYLSLCFQMNNRLHKIIYCLTCLLLSYLPVSKASAGEVVVAVASNFIKPMQRIASDFKEMTGHDAKISYGSSGKLFAQITYGAPFELFLSADSDKVSRLINGELAVSGTDFIYAQGRLVLWSSAKEFIQDSPEILLSNNFNYLALAEPKLAPYGQAADEVMQALALDKLLKDKLVTGESISQTYQFVKTGNAQLGFVALSQVNNKDVKEQGSRWLVPAALHQPINQSAVLLKRGANNPAAIALLTFLQKKATQALIKSFGYDTAIDITHKAYANVR